MTCKIPELPPHTMIAGFQTTPTVTMCLRIFLILGMVLVLFGCSTLQFQDPLRVNLAGMDALEGEGMEMRFALRLRMQNHGETPIDYDGVSLDLDLRGERFGSGVSNEHGTIPRYGETILIVPVTVPAIAIIRSVFGFATDTGTKVDYRLRGRLGGPGFTMGKSFESKGEVTLPTVPAAANRQPL